MLTSYTIELPGWMAEWLARHAGALPGDESRMQAAVDLSRENVRQATGGPYGALVVREETGDIVAAGVNRVVPGHCSAAHAEIVALSLAQQRLQCWNLGETELAPLQLVTSCEPCAMCLGAIPWSGVRSVLCGATKDDAERAGFDEGERPEDWTGVLERRGVRVVAGVLREEAARTLADYAALGGTVYNP